MFFRNWLCQPNLIWQTACHWLSVVIFRISDVWQKEIKKLIGWCCYIMKPHYKLCIKRRVAASFTNIYGYNASILFNPTMSSLMMVLNKVQWQHIRIYSPPLNPRLPSYSYYNERLSTSPLRDFGQNWLYQTGFGPFYSAHSRVTVLKSGVDDCKVSCSCVSSNQYGTTISS